MDMISELKQGLCEASEIPVDQLRDDVPLEQLGLTSFHVVSAYIWLERALDISFSGADLPYAFTATIAEVAGSIEAISVSR